MSTVFFPISLNTFNLCRANRPTRSVAHCQHIDCVALDLVEDAIDTEKSVPNFSASLGSCVEYFVSFGECGECTDRLAQSFYPVQCVPGGVEGDVIPDRCDLPHCLVREANLMRHSAYEA